MHAGRGPCALGRYLVLVGGLLLAWLGVGMPARAAPPLVFAVARLPMSLPVYVAEEQGYFAAEKLALTIADCDIGRQCLDRLLDGQADLATAAALPIVLASLRGARFSVLATIASSRGDTKIITRRGSGISSVTGLAGRRVGSFVGSSAQYFLELALLSAGVDPAQVTVVPISPAQASQDLAALGVDALAVFEPYAFRAARSLGAEAQVLGNRRLHVERWNVVASAGVGPARDRELQALCRALDRATAFINAEPAAAWAILRRRLALDDIAVDWVRPDIDFALELRQSLITGLEGQARWALRSGHADGTAPNYLDYIRPGPLAAVRRDAVGIVR